MEWLPWNRTLHTLGIPLVKFIPYALALAPAVASLWSPCSAGAQANERSVLRQLYGDLAFEVRTKGEGSVNVGAADARTSVVVRLMSTDLRRWSDSAVRVLSAKPPRRGQSARWNAVVEGPGLVSGSMALTRSVAPGDTSLVLLVTDTAFRAVRTRLTMEEGRALAAAMKRAALSSLPTRVPPPPAPKATAPGTPPPKKPPSFSRVGTRE
jgi:hypothetical protein